jgi:hypothetical protein
MPWDIIGVTAVICLLWGFFKGLKLKSKRHVKRS